MDKHNQSFFGTDAGIILQSSSWSDSSVFLRFIKKKDDGNWEKTSKNEGKNVKFNLEELAEIRCCLHGDIDAWTTKHTYKENDTEISFKWDESTDEKNLAIQVDDRRLKLNLGQSEVLKALVDHLFSEKIAHATGSTKSKRTRSGTAENSASDSRTRSKKAPPLAINGRIKGDTKKALLIEFGENIEEWVPRSTIHSDYDSRSKDIQQFEIDEWLLTKKNII